MDIAYRHNFSANGTYAPRSNFWDSLKNIKSIFAQCPCMGVALDAYFQEITRRGLVSTKDGTDENATPGQYTFITDLVRNLILYGFSAYREVQTSGLDTDVEVFYQVPDGSEVAIRFDKDQKRWVADKRGTNSMFDPIADTKTEEENPFSIIILQPPTENNAVSFGQRAMKEAERLLHFEKCQVTREVHNSRRECYISVDNNAIATTSAGVPWFQSSIPSASALGNTDYESLVTNRVNMLKAFRETTKARQREQGPHGRVGSGLPKVDLYKEQFEFPITDGHRPMEARHLLGNGNENDLLRMLIYRVWESMGVPPSALGHVPNKERASGAERATGSALDGFRTTSTHIARVLQPALDNAGLTMGKKVRVEIFKEIFPMLKPVAAIDLMSHVFDVPAEIFDKDAVREMQQAKRERKNASSNENSAEEDRGSKVQKTSIEQDVSVAKKGGL